MRDGSPLCIAIGSSIYHLYNEEIIFNLIDFNYMCETRYHTVCSLKRNHLLNEYTAEQNIIFLNNELVNCMLSLIHIHRIQHLLLHINNISINQLIAKLLIESPSHPRWENWLKFIIHLNHNEYTVIAQEIAWMLRILKRQQNNYRYK